VQGPNGPVWWRRWKKSALAAGTILCTDYPLSQPGFSGFILSENLNANRATDDEGDPAHSFRHGRSAIMAGVDSQRMGKPHQYERYSGQQKICFPAHEASSQGRERSVLTPSTFCPPLVLVAFQQHLLFRQLCWVLQQ
jgi:beta-glucosidase-like glycosyl hydrolase